MMASGEKHFSSTTMRRMPVLAQSPAPTPPSPKPCYASRANNPYVQNNIKTVGVAGADLGALIGAGIVLNIVGFPEAEAVEGIAAIDLIFELAAAEPGGSMAVGAIAGGLYGAAGGGAAGFLFTSPQCH